MLTPELVLATVVARPLAVRQPLRRGQVLLHLHPGREDRASRRARARADRRASGGRGSLALALDVGLAAVRFHLSEQSLKLRLAVRVQAKDVLVLLGRKREREVGAGRGRLERDARFGPSCDTTRVSSWIEQSSRNVKHLHTDQLHRTRPSPRASGSAWSGSSTSRTCAGLRPSST